MPSSPASASAHALLLDMDGTLVNSDAVVERCWSRWAVRHSLLPADVLKVVHGRQGHATMAALLPHRPMAENLAENALLLAEETADTDGVVPVPGAPAFLAALAPREAVVQAGYRNRFGHPAAEPMARYARREILVVATDRCGAATWVSAAPDRLRCHRQEVLRYWQHRLP